MADKPKNKGGRPTKYKAEYCKDIIEFFDVEPYETIAGKRIANPLPFLSAYARKIGVSHETLHEWCKVHPAFSEAYKSAKALQKEILINNGLLGLYNASAYIFTAKNIAGMRDNPEHEEAVEEILANITAEVAIKQLNLIKNVGMSGLDTKSIEGMYGNGNSK